MGIVGRYIDSLPARARDRVIEAQDWCVAELVGPAAARCLVGHAEAWTPLAAGDLDWRRWMDAESGDAPAVDRDVDAACAEQLFAFRRIAPADRDVYRARIERWGLSSEAVIGARFDRVSARLGPAAAIRLVKARAARRRLVPPTVAAAPVGARVPALS